jgi:hypothetical protein
MFFYAATGPPGLRAATEKRKTQGTYSNVFRSATHLLGSEPRSGGGGYANSVPKPLVLRRASGLRAALRGAEEASRSDP